MKLLCVLVSFAVLVMVLPFRSSAVAQNSLPIDTKLAYQYFQEAQALCSRDNGKLWGVSLCGPMLFVDGRTRAVVANQADKEGVLTKVGNVFVGQLSSQVTIANTATEWAGVKWMMVIFPLPEDRYRRAKLMAHELWHRVQNEIGFPSSGAANNHLDSFEGGMWLQWEWRALAVALMSRGKQHRQAIADALLFRSNRRAIFLQAASEEREMEMHEGLAEYTGVTLSGSPNLNQLVVDNLRDAVNKQTFVRSFAYASGPAYGVLLDETKTNWRKHLKKEDDLGSLLQQKLSIRLSQDVKQAAALRAQKYGDDKLRAFEMERENNRQKLLAEYRAKLVDGAVLEIPIFKMRMQMNPGTLLPLEPIGTVYPDIRVIDAWGILTVTKGALIKADFSKIYVSAPSSLEASPVQGDGWTLELNTGWAVTAGERKGDYALKKVEQ